MVRARARIVATAAMLAGCAYKPGVAGEVADGAPAGDVPATGEDGGDSSMPIWTVIETLTIDTANANPTPSTTILATGVTYHLRVSGVITNVIDAFQGDADYYDFNSPKDNGCCEDIGLGIDDLVVNDLDTQPNWGVYRADHTYEVEWVGEGRQINALFQDTFYGNNIGNLTLEILELQ